MKIISNTVSSRLFEICFHFAGHRSSTQEFSAGPSEFLPDLHFLCKIVLKPSNVIPLLLFQSSRAFSVFNFSSTGRGLKIGRPVTIQKLKPCTKKEQPDSVKGTIQIRDVMFFYFINFLGVFHSKRSCYASQYIQIYLFS